MADSKFPATDRKTDYLIALAGNANVGKSVIFNALTGLNQIVGNWPGKTVELAEGLCSHGGKSIRVVDLPGIYSLSTYSQEELVSREFIAEAKPDAVINVVDSTVLQRNLYFTLQLIEFGAPIVVALNLIDLAEASGIEVDDRKLANLLGVPVVKTSGATGRGLTELIDAAIVVDHAPSVMVRYGREVEGAIASLERALTGRRMPPSIGSYPLRFTAIKLLEADKEIGEAIKQSAAIDESRTAPAASLEGGQATPAGEAWRSEGHTSGDSTPLAAISEKTPTSPVQSPLALARALGRRLERLHGHPIATVLAAERYNFSARAVDAAVRTTKRKTRSAGERLDSFLLTKAGGWIVLVVGMFALFGVVYFVGDRLSTLLDELFGLVHSAFLGLALPTWLSDFIWEGLVQGVVAGVEVALPYIVPFYVILSVLENSGYLARIAFLTDSIMHRLGLHGKAFIPMILGIGCNVPAVMGTRIMEQSRNRLIAAVLATIVPCSARTVVILGLVGVFLGFLPAISLYLVSLVLIFIVGTVMNRLLPGDNPGLIMEMPKLRLPIARITLRQTWFRLKDFIQFAFPIIVVGSLALYLLNIAGLLGWFSAALAPFTEGVLGLPAISIIVLIFGIFRKELTLIMFAALSHTMLLNTVLSPRQIYVFAFIVMLYVPCVSTIAVLRREFGGRKAALISGAEVVGALLLGALVNWGWQAFQLLG